MSIPVEGVGDQGGSGQRGNDTKVAQVFSVVNHTCGEADTAWRMFAANICEPRWFGCSPSTVKNVQHSQKRFSSSHWDKMNKYCIYVIESFLILIKEN